MVGGKAPAFSLRDQHGNLVRSAECLARGPLIVAFFRGVWCSHCNDHLAALAAAYPEIRRAGAEVVAVTPHSAMNERGSQHVPFSILLDADLSVERSFLAACEAAAKSLRVPAHFVIAMDGVVLDAPAATSPGAPRDCDPIGDDERSRLFGEMLRGCRTAIPAGMKALGPFARASSRVGKVVSQEELAEATGISRYWYGCLETGRPGRPSAELLERLCDAPNVAGAAALDAR